MYLRFNFGGNLKNQLRENTFRYTLKVGFLHRYKFCYFATQFYYKKTSFHRCKCIKTYERGREEQGKLNNKVLNNLKSSMNGE